MEQIKKKKILGKHFWKLLIFFAGTIFVVLTFISFLEEAKSKDKILQQNKSQKKHKSSKST